MPPSPRISATLNETIYNLACEALDVTPPTVTIHTHARPGKRAFGDYSAATNHIRLFLGDISNYEYDGLRSATQELVRTLLHELRHAWQHAHNTNNGSTPEAEIDAETWACENVAGYRSIIRMSRTFPNSGFSRLGRHSRQTV